VVLVPARKGHNRWTIVTEADVGESNFVAIDGLGAHVRIHWEWCFSRQGNLQQIKNTHDFSSTRYARYRASECEMLRRDVPERMTSQKYKEGATMREIKAAERKIFNAEFP
jgi:hypothetical protein